MRSCATAPQTSGVGAASSQVPAPVSLPDPSALRLHACTHPDLVPVRHPDLPERPGVAGRFDGCGRFAVTAGGTTASPGWKDPERAQHLMDQQVRAAWPELLNAIARSLNPRHEAMFRAFPMEYYWSTYQSEWATDIMFRDSGDLARLYPRLVQHGLTTFLGPDVMRFLGRNIPASGKHAATAGGRGGHDMKTASRGRSDQASPGGRTRSRCTTSHAPRYLSRGKLACCGSKRPSMIRRTSSRTRTLKANRMPQWGGIACARELLTCTDVPRSRRPPTTATGKCAGFGWKTPGRSANWPQAMPADQTQRAPSAAVEPLQPDEAKLLDTISRGEFTINGFRNRDLRLRLLQRRNGLKAAAAPPRRGSDAQARHVARASSDQEGPRYTLLPPHQTRARRRYGPHHRTQRQLQHVDKAGSKPSNRRPAIS